MSCFSKSVAVFWVVPVAVLICCCVFGLLVGVSKRTVPFLVYRVFSFVVSRYRFCRHVSELAVPFPNLTVVVPNELLRFRYFLLRFRTPLCFVSTFAVVF